MARSRDLSLINRDQEIIDLISKGKHYSEISELYGISRARISQIAQRYYEEITDDGARDMQRAKLEKAQEVVIEIMMGPGKPVVSPGGKQVFKTLSDGSIDYENPLYDEEIRIKAALAATSISERLAKSNAWDRAKIKEKNENPAIEEAMNYLKSKEIENQRLRKQLEESQAPQGEYWEAEVVSEDQDSPGDSPEPS